MKPEFFDIHAHVNFSAFDVDRDGVIRRALETGVWVANVGTQADTSRKAIELAEKYEEGVYAIVGLHPIHTAKSFHDKQELGEGGKEFTPLENSSPQAAKSHISIQARGLMPHVSSLTGFTSRGEEFDSTIYRIMAKHPKAVAIGECGLDYYQHDTSTQMGANDANKSQEENFRKQIELAIEVGKPLMLHLRSGSGRSAYKDAFSILNSYFLLHPSKLRGNLHFFAGSIEEAKLFLDMGFSFSFTGVITFARDYDEVIRYLPLERIMSETDCPYITPAPYRGKKNEPLYVQEVVRKIAEIKDLEVEGVKKTLFSNALNFFNLNSK